MKTERPPQPRALAPAIAALMLLGRPAFADPPATAQPSAPEPSAPEPSTPEPSAPLAPADAPEPLSMTLSGGVSLGSYQAGYLYVYAEAIKASRGRQSLPLVTGASAGSANGLILAMNTCRPPNDDPTRDLGWLTWIDVGYEQLFEPDDVTSLGVLSRAPLLRAFARIRAAWHEGLRADCDVVVGITTTRLEPIELRLHEDLAVPREGERFAVRIRGRGLGRAPAISNYLDPYATVSRALLPFDGRADHDFDLLRDVVFASGAFPIAFTPQRVEHCLRDPEPAGEPLPAGYDRCPGGTRTDPFIDGGVVDNNPLRFAYSLAGAGLRQGARGDARWRDLSDTSRAEPGGAFDRLLFSYLDPDTTAFPHMEDATTREPTERIIALVTRLLGDFVRTARATELYAIVTETPELRRRMHLTRRNYPAASTHLLAFLGFFERDFRRFDYYLGMYDAYMAVRRRGVGVPPFDPRADAPAPAPWRPFRCMVGWFDHDAPVSLRRACDGDDLRNFRILLQISLDRLYDHCRRFATDALGVDPSHHCRRAAGGAAPPRVTGERALLASRIVLRPGESHFEHTMRLLSDYQFHFRDLGLDRNEAWLGRVAVRRKLLKMAGYISAAQPELADRVALITAARSAINRIAYEPPRHWAYVATGGNIELGASVLPFDWNHSWARLNLSTQLSGIETLLTSSSLELDLNVAAGPELELLFLTDEVVQPIVGARIGYHLATNDRLGARDCTELRSFDDARNCSQPIAQLYGVIALIERVRLQLTGTLYLDSDRPYDDKSFDLAFGVGWQFFE